LSSESLKVTELLSSVNEKPFIDCSPRQFKSIDSMLIFPEKLLFIIFNRRLFPCAEEMSAGAVMIKIKTIKKKITKEKKKNLKKEKLLCFLSFISRNSLRGPCILVNIILCVSSNYVKLF